LKLHIIEAGTFKLDGGAMFGVVPKSLWQRTNPADSNNLCTWAMRLLLVETGDRRILIDTGMGDKQDARFFAHYEPAGARLEDSLKAAGFSKDDISDVFLTHLHFDHCGGAIAGQGDELEPAFKNATYWSNEAHLKWATDPNPREKASFLRENILPLERSGRLRFCTEGKFVEGFNVRLFNGHTAAMMVPEIHYKGQTLFYVTDLLPSVGHIPLPYVMAYDTRPLITMDEKRMFLDEAASTSALLFLEHDPINVGCRVIKTEKGVRLKEIIDFGAL